MESSISVPKTINEAVVPASTAGKALAVVAVAAPFFRVLSWQWALGLWAATRLVKALR